MKFGFLLYGIYVVISLNLFKRETSYLYLELYKPSAKKDLAELEAYLNLPLSQF